jgi:hypothetical protein
LNGSPAGSACTVLAVPASTDRVPVGENLQMNRAALVWRPFVPLLCTLRMGVGALRRSAQCTRMADGTAELVSAPAARTHVFCGQGFL